jgi:GAF domain-containing protein
LERLVAGLPAEAGALWDDLQAVKRRLRQLESAADAFDRQRGELEQKLSGAQRRTAELSRQLVTVRRLHSSLERGELLLAVEEIVASLIGCEEWAVFEKSNATSPLAPIKAVGLSLEELAALGHAHGPIARCAATGELWVVEDRGAGSRSEPRLTACVPLQLGENVVGVLALFRLLDHKAELENADVELLDLLAAHAGTALAATRVPALRVVR